MKNNWEQIKTEYGRNSFEMSQTQWIKRTCESGKKYKNCCGKNA